MTNYLADFDARTLPGLSQCVLLSGESVRFTSLGIRRYAQRFARAGIDINKLRTAAQLQAALEASAEHELAAFADYVEAKHGAGLERDWLVTAAVGTESDLARLSGKLRARRQSGLRVVKRAPQAKD